MKLTSGGAVSYSPAEKEVFALLSSKQQTTSSLVERRYTKRGEPAPFHAKTSIVGIIRTLARKIDHNKEPFVLKTTARTGPRPMTCWLEKREEKR